MSEKVDKRVEKIIDLIQEGEIEKALESATIDDTNFLLLFGALFWEEGMYDKAALVFGRIIQLVPDNAEAWYNKGVALGNLGQHEEAISCFDEALQVDPHDAQAWYNKGVALGNLGKYEEAISCFDEALQVDPHHAQAWYNKGATLCSLGKYEEAISCFDDALQVDPHLVQAWYNKGVALSNLGKHEEAISCYDEALQVDFHLAQSWSNKGVALGTLGKYEEAIGCFDDALQVDPHYTQAWSNKGVALVSLGKYEEAIGCYDEALQVDPHDAQAWSNKGVALGNLGKYEEAIGCYDEALQVDPHLAEAYFNRGLTLLDLFHYEQAIHNLQQAKELFSERRLTKDADEATGYQLWAKALQNWSKEQYEKAVSQFRKAASIFKVLQFNMTAHSLELLTTIIPLDQQFMNSLQVHSLPEFKEKNSKICREIQQLLVNIKEKDISEKAQEILRAKVHCFTALCDALQFNPPDFEQLAAARKTFEKVGFDTSIYAVNSLENIIRVFSNHERIDDIPDHFQDYILGELKNLSVLDGALTGKIPIEKEHKSKLTGVEDRSTTARVEEPEVVLHRIEDTQKEWVRVCLVQLDAPLEYIHTGEFGYILTDKEKTKKKVFEALEIAQENDVDIICFPELTTLEEWVHKAQEYKECITVFGTYYKYGFNTCPIIVNGKDYYIQKISPSPQFETEVISGMKMKKGKKIFVFQTKCGSFAVLICMDYLKEIHRILYNKDEEIRNIDFILVPAYNKDIDRFQKKGDIDCQEGNYPYIVQVNCSEIDGKKTGGSCVIGTEHSDAVTRYKNLHLRLNDTIEYKLVELDTESIIIVDLDIKRKGVPVPASGPKMKVLKKFIHEKKKKVEKKNRSILKLEGRGKEIWESVDIQEYADRERDSWIGK
jgi:tetratricopeptide (TPR) repeat protein